MSQPAGFRRRLVAIAATAVAAASVAVPAQAAIPQPVVKVDTSSRAAYVKSVAPLARENQIRYGVPASVTIAQSILESGWGTSQLTQRGQAYFGIKCKTVTGPYATGCLTMPTNEVVNGQTITIVDGFRTYRNARDSFLDHGYFLTTNGRYAPAFAFKKDPDRFIAEVAKAGYATDPRYADSIVGLMRTQNLYQYDKVSTK